MRLAGSHRGIRLDQLASSCVLARSEEGFTDNGQAIVGTQTTSLGGKRQKKRVRVKSPPRKAGGLPLFWL
jgi:hypothetical protein